MQTEINDFSIGLFLWQLVLIVFALILLFVIYKFVRKYIFYK